MNWNGPARLQQKMPSSMRPKSRACIASCAKHRLLSEMLRKRPLTCVPHALGNHCVRESCFALLDEKEGPVIVQPSLYFPR